MILRGPNTGAGAMGFRPKSMIGGRVVSPEFLELAGQFGFDNNILTQFLTTFAIDSGLEDTELAVPPSVHRDSMIGAMLQLSQTTDKALTKKLIGLSGAMIKVSNGLKRRMRDEETKLWAPTVTMINSARALNRLDDEQLKASILDTKAKITDLPLNVQEMFFDYFL